ncbi:putative VP3 [Gammapolyomavirus phacarbo]|nr:putative VP3 [cormorant polyomavirus 1]
MALMPYLGDLTDLAFPGVQWFAETVHTINPIDWGPRFLENLSRWIMQTLWQQGRRQLEQATTELAQRTRSTMADALARMLENARWVVTNVPSQLYSSLEEYYGDLPRVRPWQYRQIAERAGITPPEDYILEEGSGEFVYQMEAAPGGAHQNHCPDWVLPLILGLFEYPPRTAAEKRKAETKNNAPPAKKRMPRTSTRPKASNKRGYRGPRTKNRSR